MSSTRTETVPPRVSVKVDGTDLAADVHDAITDLRVTDRFGVPAHARLVFEVNQSGGGLPPDRVKVALGNQLQLTVIDGTGSWTIFDGLVVSLGIELDTGTTQHLVVEGYDRLYLLGRQTAVKAKQNVTRSDIISDLIGECGLSVGSVTGLQAAQLVDTYHYGTAYALIDRIVRDAGCEWYVAGTEFNVRPRSAAAGDHTLEVGKNLISFRARFSVSEHVDEVTVTGWDVQQKRRIVGTAKIADAQAKSNIGLKIGDVAKTSVGGKKLFAVPQPAVSQDDAKALADGIAQRRAGEMLRARGEARPAATIKPGVLLSVVGLGETWSGDYYCTGVEHTFGRGPLHTYFEVGPSEPESLVDLAGEAGDPLGRVLNSLTVGIVTNNKDDSSLNRVRVKLPYLSDDLETGWARVLQPGSGSNRGWNVMPEINDEVLVGFEHGDLSRPFVLGGLINGKDVPKYAHADTVKNGKVVSRTFNSRLGHELRFSDGDDAATQYVQVRTAKTEVNLMLAADKVELNAPDVPIKVYNKKGSIEINEQGDITIKGTNITIEAQQNLKFKAVGIESKSSAATKVEASATLDLKANAPATLESSAITIVKGSMVKIN